ncbi:MAG: TetR family transcriptional regulator, partial [Jatrophihabitantaceae bacterium]
MNSTVHATAQKRAPVTTAALIAKAIELIETAGLEALSMRRLGEAFGIQAASVYWYVASKDNLLDLVADELNRQAAAYLTARKRPCQTGTLQLTHLGYLYRSFLYAHPQSELLLAARLPAGPNRVDLIGAFVADLITCHAVPGETAVAAAAAVRAFTH